MLDDADQISDMYWLYRPVSLIVSLRLELVAESVSKLLSSLVVVRWPHVLMENFKSCKKINGEGFNLQLWDAFNLTFMTVKNSGDLV